VWKSASLVGKSPYCISGDEFSPMATFSGGRFVCGKCGHLAIPTRTLAGARRAQRRRLDVLHKINRELLA
jgi:ribosomal protein S27AE